MRTTRKASHAGSWYNGDGKKLQAQLTSWLDSIGSEDGGISLGELAGGGADGYPHVRAIIAPHAGYAYSGCTAAYAYAAVDSAAYDRVFILGPSHHMYLDGCALTAATQLETPLGRLQVDVATVTELRKSGLFTSMSMTVDEAEHSIEMHLPYVAHIFRERLQSVKVVAVLVGALGSSSEKRYGEFFAKYLEDARTLFIVSSDFCHWGRRFRYQYYDKSVGEIYESIRDLDLRGVQAISRRRLADFQEYQAKFSNTICGRHPIAVLLAAIERSESARGRSYTFNFTRYKQSSLCRTPSDSSVSYVSAHVTGR